MQAYLQIMWAWERFDLQLIRPENGVKCEHECFQMQAVTHMIRKGQLSDEYIPVYKQFMDLAG